MQGAGASHSGCAVLPDASQLRRDADTCARAILPVLYRCCHTPRHLIVPESQPIGSTDDVYFSRTCPEPHPVAECGIRRQSADSMVRSQKGRFTPLTGYDQPPDTGPNQNMIVATTVPVQYRSAIDPVSHPDFLCPELRTPDSRLGL